MTSKQHVPFPVSRDDVAAAIAASLQSTVDSKSSHEGSMTPKIFPRAPSPTTSPGSARGTPPPGPGKLALGGSGFVNLMNLSPSSGTTSKNSSRRPSGSGTPDSFPIDSRRGSVKSTADAMRKSVKNVADNTKKATHKVKDKTAGMSAQMKVARKGARKWVANHSSKTAKAAMEQAKSGLSGGEKFTLFAFEKITLLSRRGFTHVFMFLILIGYTALGALLFMAFEAPHEEVEKLAIHEKRMAFINYLYNYSGTDYDQYVLDAKASLLPFEDQLYKGFAAGVSYDTDDRVWTFWKAMFFCSTITTTIGYGHIAPKTTAGQALTIGYALIGIPIFLILMADFGKLFTRLLKALFIFIRKCYKSNTCKSVRKNKHVKATTTKLSAFRDTIFCRWKEDEEEKVEDGKPKKTAEELKAAEEAEDKYFADGNFNLPITLALFILILYMIVGCFVYINWEDWTFFEAFYFIFISMTTIGFGDFVPQHPAFMMATALYLVFGLALTAMCINIIQEKLTDTFREASTKLKTQFSHIMAQSALAGQGEEEDTETETPSMTTIEVTEDGR